MNLLCMFVDCVSKQRKLSGNHAKPLTKLLALHLRVTPPLSLRSFALHLQSTHGH